VCALVFFRALTLARCPICVPCAVNTRSSADFSTCDPCPAGQFSNVCAGFVFACSCDRVFVPPDPCGLDGFRRCACLCVCVCVLYGCVFCVLYVRVLCACVLCAVGCVLVCSCVVRLLVCDRMHHEDVSW